MPTPYRSVRPSLENQNGIKYKPQFVYFKRTHNKKLLTNTVRVID